MSIKEKIIVGALAALFVLALMALWAYFVTIGRADSQAFIAQIGVLITGAVSLVTIWCGHQAASSRAASTDAMQLPAPPSNAARDVALASESARVATAASAGTLQ
ncbi:hypothetical protein G5S35_08135 [Paraburkholderia tropica]|uniref:hypothetical protein n=1 Tax=Paraburkholderia tropica TaxID=92647 RepID=UPI0016013C64|nr:hypothetical protein [Paraburkholderia tropica]QNB11551.1 hypothetical protein G5S35_08135 [Paraburkholderia tropica]